MQCEGVKSKLQNRRKDLNGLRNGDLGVEKVVIDGKETAYADREEIMKFKHEIEAIQESMQQSATDLGQSHHT